MFYINANLKKENLLAAAVMLDIPANKNLVRSSFNWDFGAAVAILDTYS